MTDGNTEVQIGPAFLAGGSVTQPGTMEPGTGMIAVPPAKHLMGLLGTDVQQRASDKAVFRSIVLQTGIVVELLAYSPYRKTATIDPTWLTGYAAIGHRESLTSALNAEGAGLPTKPAPIAGCYVLHGGIDSANAYVPVVPFIWTSKQALYILGYTVTAGDFVQVCDETWDSGTQI